MALYNEDSIQKMDPLTFCRHRPDAYLGSNENSTQLVREIISNCSDEFLIGNCDFIEINYNEDENIVDVRDEGQGILPNIVKEDGKTVLQMIYQDLNVSGKYDKSENAVYKVSTGAFGIGSSLVNYLANWLIATTKRDGQYERVYFEEGVFSKRESGRCPKNEHGVEVKFKPSPEFFVSEKPDIAQLKRELFNLSCVCAGLRIIFNGEEFYHPSGLADLVKSKVRDEYRLTSSDLDFCVEEGTQKLDFYMAATDRSSCDIAAFCNYSLIETGAPVSAVKTCLTKTLNKWGKEKDLIKGKSTISGSDIQEGMIIAFNLVSQNIRYDSQIKVRATSTEDNPFINQHLAAKLLIWLDNNPDDGKAIIEKALLAKKASEAAKKARENVKAKKKKKEKVFNLPTKLVDCWCKDRSKAELLLSEGLSSASGLVEARDSETQAVYGLRGKCLSVRKAADDKVMRNQEINNVVVALGLDYNPKTGKMKYDKNKLRYGKIIACADADFDGYAIENLIFNFLWYLCPELIINGHVYSAVPPLFRITTKKNEYIYLKNQKELDDYKKKHSKNIKSINRAKGLGEQDTEELEYSLLNPETRNIVQLKVEDLTKTEQMFEDLYGKAVEPRVKFLAEHSEEVEGEEFA